MTGKQRFDAIIHHRKPDRFPIYIPTIACSVASQILGRRVFTGADSLHFQEELSLSYGKEAHREFEEAFIADSAELNRALRVDVVRETWRSRARPDKRLDEHTLLFGDEEGEYIVKRYFPDTETYGVIEDTRRPVEPEELIASLRHGLSQPEQIPAREQFLAANGSSVALFDKLRDLDLGEIVSGGGFGIPMTDTAWLEACVIEPEVLCEHFMRVSRYEAARIGCLADAGYIWFNGGLDMASNAGPVFSPKTFRQIMLKPLTNVASVCRERDAVLCYRTDGNIWPVFEDMFTVAGVQAFGEVDRDAGMTVGRVRQAHDGVIVLGNMSSAFLTYATPQQVREETRRHLEEAEGTNFIPGPSNAVMAGTPVDNLLAMIQAIEDFAVA